jgi:hypothetical protein
MTDQVKCGCHNVIVAIQFNRIQLPHWHCQGAHVGAQTDSCNATYLMSYWVRDRNKLTGRDGIGD